MDPAPFRGAFKGRRVLLTGDTGFKGSWLCYWLLRLGADVSGLALEPATDPALFRDLELASRMAHTNGDIRNASLVDAVMHRVKPDVVFHLAAQPLVRRSYSEPVYTFETNVLGTVNVLDAARRTDSVGALVVVTTDKVYRNAGSGRAFSEDDALGGHDPYAASKACAELVTSAYRDSFLRSSGIPAATVRAGNVIGGGDWAEDRIVPDCVRSLVADEPIAVRNPDSVRPWQHVLEPLSAYLWLATLMLEGEAEDVAALNFGPDPGSARTVGELADRFVEAWGRGSWRASVDRTQMHEARTLGLDISLAETTVGWRPVWGFDIAVDRTAGWYRGRMESVARASALTDSDVSAYMRDAVAAGVRWAAGS